MSDPCKNLPETIRSDQTVAVLAVSPSDEDHIDLRGIFNHTRWRIHGVHAFGEARDYLSSEHPAVVVCERQLPDGTWRDLYELACSMPEPPKVIVTSENADDSLWAEVLNIGGYDVLSKPFERAEVTRIISLAWLHWKESMPPARETARKQAASVLKSRPAAFKTAGS